MAFSIRIPNGQLSINRYFFFEMGGLNSTGPGWVVVLQLINFAQERRNIINNECTWYQVLVDMDARRGRKR